MTGAFDDGYESYFVGAKEHENPHNWTDGHDMHPDEYFEWANGWRAGELDANIYYASLDVKIGE